MNAAPHPFEAAIRAKIRHAPCIDSLGIQLLEFAAGTCRISARRDPAFDGVQPGFHGGLLATVADCAAWFAIVTQTGPDEPLVTTDLHVRYLNPCLSDVIAAARVIKLGRTLCPVSVELCDLQGKSVAVASVTYIRVANLAANPVGNDRAAAR